MLYFFFFFEFIIILILQFHFIGESNSNTIDLSTATQNLKSKDKNILPKIMKITTLDVRFVEYFWKFFKFLCSIVLIIENYSFL